MSFEIDKEFRARKITNPIYELDEFDAEWVNPASRKDISTLAQENKDLVGLKLWDYTFFSNEELKDPENIKNFMVSLIFDVKHKEEMEALIKSHELEVKTNGYCMARSAKFLNKLYSFAVYCPVWQ